MPASEKIFDQQVRMTRSDVTFLRDIKGKLESLSIYPPEMKNSRTTVTTHMMLHVNFDEKDPVNAGRAIWELFQGDPVPTKDWEVTPLFRDVEKPKFPLDMSFMRRLDRKLISKNPHFHGRSSTAFGQHSYRIGGVAGLINVNCGELPIGYMGRWKGDSKRLYVRLAKEAILKWQQRLMSAANFQVEEDEAEGEEEGKKEGTGRKKERDGRKATVHRPKGFTNGGSHSLAG
jgi:hypothetical protein